MESLLSGLLPPEAVLSDPAALQDLAVDGLVPRAAVSPGTVEEAARVIRLANREGWAVIPWGGGTSLSLGRPPQRLDLVLSLSRLNRIIDLDPANLTATVQAGVVLSDLQDLLAGAENRCYFPLDGRLKEKAEAICSDRDYKGVRLPLDPPRPDRATLGGLVAANASGPQRHRFGQARDLVLGLRFILPTGEIIGAGGKTVKNVSGYDVSKLLIGSLGSLGLIAEMTFRLLPLPEEEAAWAASFAGLDQAGAFARELLDSRLLPTAVELLNRPALKMAPSLGLEASLGGWWLAVGLAGFGEEVERQLGDLDWLAERHEARDQVRLEAGPARRFWAELAGAGRAEAGRPPVRFKGRFPLAATGQVLADWSRAVEESGLEAVLQNRAGLGLAWVHLPSGGLEEIGRLGENLRRIAAQAGGGLIVEAAPAELKDKLEVWGPPGPDFALMAELKKRFDPQGVLNPGRFLGGL